MAKGGWEDGRMGGWEDGKGWVRCGESVVGTPRAGTRRWCLVRGLLLVEVADAIEMGFGADEKSAVGYRAGSQGAFAEGIARQWLKGFPRRQHDADALFVLQINASVR